MITLDLIVYNQGRAARTTRTRHQRPDPASPRTERPYSWAKTKKGGPYYNLLWVNNEK